MLSYLLFCGKILTLFATSAFRRRGLSPSQVAGQMVVVGVRAIPMVTLTSFSIGVTLAMQAANELSRMGATAYLPDLVGISLMRELGPLIVAVVVIGRSGSAVTAELGTMRVGEEIDALEVMDIDPIRYLAGPRIAALLVLLPILTVFGDLVGIVGGWSVCFFAMDMNSAVFLSRIMDGADAWDFHTGVIKSIVFAWLIGTIACHEGLQVEGGAEGVGRATTRSVVLSILALLLSNAVMTALFFFTE